MAERLAGQWLESHSRVEPPSKSSLWMRDTDFSLTFGSGSVGRPGLLWSVAERCQDPQDQQVASWVNQGCVKLGQRTG